MAEFGAHLTSTQGGDDGSRPSMFEVLAQETLMKSLQPAIKYAAQVLAQKNPPRYGSLLRYNDELYALLGLVLEEHYLRKFSSSFSENFYGLKRVRRTPGNNGDETLTRSQRLRSLLCLILVPYVKRKCEQLYEKYQDADPRTEQNSVEARLLKGLAAVYPYVHTVWEATILCYQLAYVFGRSRVHTPLLSLAGVALTTLDQDDLLFQEACEQHKENPRSVTARGLLLAQRALGLVAVGVSSGLSVSMFFLQFLEWWYASDSNVASLTSLPTPPPPKKLQIEGLPSLPNLCPLCLRIRTNDTAIASSGFVFCYPCIYKYVSQHQRCPITGCPSNTEQLIKLYIVNQ